MSKHLYILLILCESYILLHCNTFVFKVVQYIGASTSVYYQCYCGKTGFTNIQTLIQHLNCNEMFRTNGNQSL